MKYLARFQKQYRKQEDKLRAHRSVSGAVFDSKEKQVHLKKARAVKQRNGVGKM